MLRAGTLNRRVRIERSAPQRDAAGDPVFDPAGDPVVGWAEVAAVWADIRFDSGLNTIRNEAPTAVARASIRIRYRRDVEQGMRAVHDGVVYAIRAVLPDAARREYVDLVCEVVNG